MTLWNAILVGLKEIWAHKFRSALTMLGIVLGVSSLVTMSAMVQGMENGAREALVARFTEALGDNLGVGKNRVRGRRVVGLGRGRQWRCGFGLFVLIRILAVGQSQICFARCVLNRAVGCKSI